MDGCTARLTLLHPSEGDDAATLPTPEEQQLSFRARQILNLELQGLRKVEIAVRLGLAESTVSYITLSPSYIAVRNARLDHYTHTTIRAMIPQAVRTLEEAFHSPHEHIRLAAAGMTFKILGYMHHGKECEAYTNNGITAEDVCRRLLLAAQSAAQPSAAQVQERQELQEVEQAQAAAL
jgi:hypothetical protein